MSDTNAEKRIATRSTLTYPYCLPSMRQGNICALEKSEAQAGPYKYGGRCACFCFERDYRWYTGHMQVVQRRAIHRWEGNALCSITMLSGMPMQNLELNARCDICNGCRAHGNHRSCSKKRQQRYAQARKGNE